MPGRGQQFVLARLARSAHGGADTAAARRDLGVGGPRGALFELIGAIAGEHRVRVRVHEPRKHDPAAGVHHFGSRR